jgi:hypothetical protein
VRRLVVIVLVLLAFSLSAGVGFAVGQSVGYSAGHQAQHVAHCQQLSDQYTALIQLPSSQYAFDIWNRRQPMIAAARDAYQQACG